MTSYTADVAWKRHGKGDLPPKRLWLYLAAHIS